MKVVLAMDLGTTGNRVVAFSRDGKVAAKAYREFSQIFPKPGWVEHDPLEIWDGVISCLREVVKNVGNENIACLGITNQRETTVLWDRKTGEPVGNAIVWQCRRTASMCQSLKTHEKEVKRRTGLFIDPYFSATKIRWMLDHIEGLEKRALNGEILFGTIDCWILWKLTNGRVHATEPSNASRTLLYDIHEMKYEPQLLKIFGIPESILPEVKDSAGDFGAVDASHVGAEIPICGILGDQQASLFGQGGWQKGVVKNTYGTGLFVMTSTGGEIPESGKLINTVAWKIGDETVYAMEGSIFVGGAAMQWLRDGLKILPAAEESQKMAEELRGNENVYFVPALSGLGAPYWDPDARGMIIGLTRGTGPEHIVRAALEAMAYQTRDVVEEMKQVYPEMELRLLRVDGGAVANDFLMQFQSDILGLKVERPEQRESTVWGAAGIAGVVSGFWSREEFLKIHKIDKVYKPGMTEKNREALYTKWKRAVRKCMGWEIK